MSQRRAGHINRCLICRINTHFCVCEHLNPLQVSTLVSLVVHVRELKLTSNTAQFVQKMLPDQAEIFIRGRVNEVFEADPILKRPGRTLFLYPHEDSEELNAEFLKRYPGPYHLIVPDGNWQQARKVRQREDKFKDLLTVRLPAGIVGEYKLRLAPQPEWVSTYEACAHALAVLESPECRDQMMAFFRRFVKATLNSRSGNFSFKE
jgi:DTW domain-containing protein YfiP